MVDEHGKPSPQAAQAKARIEAVKRGFEQRRNINQKLENIGYKIGVYSGKGGVGKTSVAVNLACYLAKQGHSVGILDVDIDCPNVTKAMGMTERATIEDGTVTPGEQYGVKVVSMSYFQKSEDEAIIWRGPMIHNAINQFLQMTEWGQLDYLIVDLPPGTSDGPLTVMQTITLDGFVVVTTPHFLSALDAKRSINMIRKLNVNVLGIVENFVGDIFGKGAGETLAKELQLSFLGGIELRSEYRMVDIPPVLRVDEIEKEYESIVAAINTVIASKN